MNRRHRNASLELLLGIILSGCAVEGGGEDVGVDVTPIVGGVAASAYPEAATLNMDVTAAMYYACSGTLIAPRVVLTAGHCVTGHRRWDVYVGTAYRSSTSAAVYDWPALDSDIVSPSYHDVGLVFLSDAIALSTSFPMLATGPYPVGTKALNVGRDVGPDATHYQVTTSLYEAPITLQTNPLYPYDYSSSDVIQPGDSGGPVFLSGTHTILAVNSGAAAGVSEVMARVDLVAEWISAQVAAHGGYGAKAPVTDAAAKADASVPLAGAAAKTDASSSTADASSQADANAPGGSSPACPGTTETEPDNTWPTASVLTRVACGALTPAGDVDWYSLVLDAGTYVVELLPTGDATMSLGVASGSNCTLTLASAKAASVRVSGARATLCIQVVSPKTQMQSYEVVVTP
jgi:hypothetical protein